MDRDPDARLVEFSFSSRLAADQCPVGLMQLARQIWRSNVRAGLTGVLRRMGTDLDQTIEGPSCVILPLSARILTDRRHCEIAIRSFGPIAERRHSRWIVEGFELPVEARPDQAAFRGNLCCFSAAKAAVSGGETRYVAASAP